MFTKIIHHLIVFTILFFIIGCYSADVEPISSNKSQSVKNNYHADIEPKDTIEKDIVYYEEAKIEEPIDYSNNTPPIAYSQSLRVDKNRFISFYLYGKDKDNDKLIYRVVKQPEHGVLSQWGDSNNSGMYIPDHDYYGEDSFTFVINDGCVDSKEVCVSIKIQNVKRVIPYYNPAPKPVGIVEGTLTATLNWNQDPRDLDAHLVKYDSSNNREYHIYYGHRQDITTGDILDTDNTDGFGPETIIIQNIDNSAKYVYAVHKYSGSGDITSSGATLKVETSNYSRIFNTPSSGTERWWKVFEIENGRIIPCVNECLFDSSSEALRSRSLRSITKDPQWLLDMSQDLVVK